MMYHYIQILDGEEYVFFGPKRGCAWWKHPAWKH